MNESKEMKTQDRRTMQTRSGQEVFLRPAVDIYEDTSRITLLMGSPVGIQCPPLVLEMNTVAVISFP